MSRWEELPKGAWTIRIREHWLLSRRIEAEEWLDHGQGSPEAIEQSLADLQRINRWLGGIRSLASHLYPRLRAGQGGPVQVLDLGAGGCTLALAIAQWASRQSVPLRLLAVDFQHAHLRWARPRLQAWPQVMLVQADASAPPLRERSVDFVISSLFLHHFTAAELIQLLPRWMSLARRSLVMTDLVRHPLPYWFMQVAGPIFARSAITRHDAAVSIRRGYRPHELRDIAVAAGFLQARVFRHFPYRMTLVIDRPEASVR
jgi:2-polyprenyl-3-methyl-5-hydroxy-6-metoxy-1,4-benzoquinol methylase